MSSHITEEQQIETLKKFWKEYGLSIVSGIAIALLIGFGWRFYQKYVTERAEQASVVYEKMMVNLMNNQPESAKGHAEELIKKFSRTPYAKLASLAMAKSDVAQNKFDSAIKNLKLVIAKSFTNDSLVQIATIRLARIYLLQNNAEEALKVLSKINNKTFLGLASSVKGDAYLKLGDKEKAIEAYQYALDNLPESSVRSLLQMKFDSLEES